MKLEELVAMGHTRLRRDPWNEYAHVSVTWVEANGTRVMSAWVKLWDLTAGIFDGAPMNILLLSLPLDDEWEPWVITDAMRELHPNYDWSKFEDGVPKS